MNTPPFMQYSPPPSPGFSPRYLIELRGKDRGRSFVFYDHLEIGRYEPGRGTGPGCLRVQDPTVSSQHCLIRLGQDGHCYVRDVSRNGLRIEGRRTVPNVETPLKVGQVISLGNDLHFQLEGKPLPAPLTPTVPLPGTAVTADVTACTLVVGDIRNFTQLVERTMSSVLQHAVTRVFELLQAEVERQGGTVKEYQGDAIVAFWELGPDGSGVNRACRGALALDRLARKMAEDPAIWDVPDFPLGFDWALTTGPVSFENVGGANPTGLSMVGEPVVLAFRLEKLADPKTGPILVCPATRKQAGDAFTFRSLGRQVAEGFSRPIDVFSLLAEVPVQNEDKR